MSLPGRTVEDEIRACRVCSTIWWRWTDASTTSHHDSQASFRLVVSNSSFWPGKNWLVCAFGSVKCEPNPQRPIWAARSVFLCCSLAFLCCSLAARLVRFAVHWRLQIPIQFFFLGVTLCWHYYGSLWILCWLISPSKARLARSGERFWLARFYKKIPWRHRHQGSDQNNQTPDLLLR